MLNKKFNLSKRFMLAFAIITIVTLAFAASAFAASYGIDAPSGRITLNPTVSDTVTVPVTGAGENQITIVVRKDNSDWVSDPSANVLYIDQVKGEGERTNIVFGIDTDKWAEDTYKIFVGGSGMDPVSADLVISSEQQEGVSVTGYIQTFASGATVQLAEGITTTTDANGMFTFTDVEPGNYDLVITAKSALTRTISITVTDADVAVSTSDNKITLMYGDIDGSGKIDNSDLLTVKGLFNKTSSDTGFDANADLNDSGKIDNSDLLTVKGLFNKTSSDYDN